MKTERFGRLNTKRLNEYLESIKENAPYDMGGIFPFSKTHKFYKESRHAIQSFKNMCHSYRYCYKLHETCIAYTKTKVSKGNYEFRHDIDNKRYVFTNISPDNIDLYDCELIYDRDWKIDYRDKNETIDHVLKEMKHRKASYKQVEFLEKYLKKNHILENDFHYLQAKCVDEYDNHILLDEMQKKYNDHVPNCYEDPLFDPEHHDPSLYYYAHLLEHYISKEIFEEFKWRVRLYDTDIYKSSVECDIDFKGDRKVKSIYYSIIEPLSRVYNLNGFINTVFAHRKELDKIFEYQKSSLKFNYVKLCSDFRENSNLENLFLSIDTDGCLKKEALLQKTMIDNLVRKYSYLENPYGKPYRDKFRRYRQIYTKWQTQERFRRLKKEYKKIKELHAKLESDLKQIQDYLLLIRDIEVTYEKDLGENGVPNQGFGRIGDGFEYDEDDLAEEIRIEEQWQRQGELLNRKSDEDLYDEYLMQQGEYDPAKGISDPKEDLHGDCFGQYLIIKEYENSDDFQEVYHKLLIYMKSIMNTDFHKPLGFQDYSDFIFKIKLEIDNNDPKYQEYQLIYDDICNDLNTYCENKKENLESIEETLKSEYDTDTSSFEKENDAIQGKKPIAPDFIPGLDD